MTDVIPFSFEGARVRVVTRDGDPWFVLVDVCRFLSLTNSSTAARRLDDDERHTLNTEEGIADRRAQQITIVSESGLYSLIMTSRRPEAKRFKKWVTSEVLPEIRKRGSYGSRPADAVAMLSDPDTLRALLLDYSGRVKALEAEKAVMQPKVEALDRIAGADGHLTITEAAKALQMRPKDLFAYLRQKGWIYKRPGSAYWLGYQSRTSTGHLTHKVTTITRGDGSEKVVEQVLVTPKGLAALAAAATASLV